MQLEVFLGLCRRCRLVYALELMQHITVHSYGQCLHNMDFPADNGTDYGREAYFNK